MTPEENKALVRRFYAEIDKGNLDAMDELVAENRDTNVPPTFCAVRFCHHNASVSIKLTSDPGPDPIIAGRICGRFSADSWAAVQLAIAAKMKQDSLVELMRTN